MFQALKPLVEMTAFGAHVMDANPRRDYRTVRNLLVPRASKALQTGRRMCVGAVVDVFRTDGRLTRCREFAGKCLPFGFCCCESSRVREKQGLELVGLDVGKKALRLAASVLHDRFLKPGLDFRCASQRVALCCGSGLAWKIRG